MTTTRNRETPVQDVNPTLLSEWLAKGEIVLVDVREDFEYAEEHIAGSVLAPLSRFDPEAIRAEHGGARVVFYCRTGRRSADAAKRYRRGDEPVFHAAGGIEQWKAADGEVVRPLGGPRLPVMRQVQVVAGSLVVLSVALGTTLSPWFLAMSGFVGCGLVFAGLSGWCGMGVLLSKMPWNRRTCAPCDARRSRSRSRSESSGRSRC